MTILNFVKMKSTKFIWSIIDEVILIFLFITSLYILLKYGYDIFS